MVLKFVECSYQKFLCILLFSDVRAHTIEGFEGEAKRSWVVVLTVREHQKAKHVHHLVQKVVINFYSFMFLQVSLYLIVCSQQTVPERWLIEELLHH